MQLQELKQPCKVCGTVAWERLQRQGFVEEKILPFFDKYPWRCAICNFKRYLSLRQDPMLRTRGRSRSRD